MGTISLNFEIHHLDVLSCEVVALCLSLSLSLSLSDSRHTRLCARPSPQGTRSLVMTCCCVCAPVISFTVGITRPQAWLKHYKFTTTGDVRKIGRTWPRVTIWRTSVASSLLLLIPCSPSSPIRVIMYLMLAVDENHGSSQICLRLALNMPA